MLMLKSKVERLESRLASFSDDHEHLLRLHVKMMKLEDFVEELEEKVGNITSKSVEELKVYLDKLLKDAEFSDDSETICQLSDSCSSCEKLSFTDKESIVVIQ